MSLNLTPEKYEELYKQSIERPEDFWNEQAERITWQKKWDKVKNTSFLDDIRIKWFEGAKLNICYNCVDRHLPEKANQTAIIWEGDEGDDKKISYQQLFDEVCKFAAVLKEMGIKKGDRVIIYMPMILEAAYAMLACARIGAVHSVVFAGFSPEAIKGRIEDCKAEFIITADFSKRGGKSINLKNNVDEALEKVSSHFQKLLLVKNSDEDVNFIEGRDICYHQVAKNIKPYYDFAIMDAEDPFFILYTSGSTGKPKGVLHSSAGYIVYVSMTHQYAFDYRDGEIYWCTADIGWITGHSYIIYGPLANGATTLMFEGVPNYPDYSRFWQIVDKHKVNIFYTAPTAIRALMKEGDEFVQKTSRESLRVLGTVGEPINPEAWHWYDKVVGQNRCPIIDTWWQTETGGFLITPLVGATKLKAGSAGLPFFGVEAVILDKQGKEVKNGEEGALCFKNSWPGQMRTVFGDHERFIQTYFSDFSGFYFSGDGAKKDEDGFYWIIGRIDDVINVSGHRLGTAEIESALVAHKFVAEAAVVGKNDHVKGQAIHAYVILNSGVEKTNDLEIALQQYVRKEISPIAKPDCIEFVSGLPKTRSGKIMRRILRKISNGEKKDFGDIKTLVNPEIIDEILRMKKASS